MDKWGDLSQVQVYLEHRVEFAEMVRGTADQIIVGPDFIHVIDYKYGEGKLVSAEQNYQLAFYAIAARKKYGAKARTIVSIFQPRVSDSVEDKYSEWEISEHELDLFEELFNKTIEDVASGEVHFRKGEHCQFCPVKPRCPEYGAELVKIEKLSYPAPELLDESIAERVHTQGDAIISWIRSVQNYNLRKAVSGHKFECLKLVEGRAFRKWTDQVEVIAEEIEAHGLDPYDKKLKPFSSVEKAIGKKKFEQVFSHLIEKPQGKLKLVGKGEKGQEVVVNPGSEFDNLDLFTEMEDE
jgi:hypothetical protein